MGDTFKIFVSNVSDLIVDESNSARILTECRLALTRARGKRLLYPKLLCLQALPGGLVKQARPQWRESTWLCESKRYEVVRARLVY